MNHYLRRDLINKRKNDIFAVRNWNYDSRGQILKKVTLYQPRVFENLKNLPFAVDIQEEKKTKLFRIIFLLFTKFV